MVFTNVYMDCCLFHLDYVHQAFSQTLLLVFSAGAGTLMKILLLESALSLGHNFATHSLFREIFFDISDFTYTARLIDSTWVKPSCEKKASRKPNCHPYENAPLINHWEITDFPLIYFSIISGIKIGTWLSLTMHWLIIDLSWDYWMINADFPLYVKWYSLISHWIFHDYHVISDW